MALVDQLARAVLDVLRLKGNPAQRIPCRFLAGHSPAQPAPLGLATAAHVALTYSLDGTAADVHPIALCVAGRQLVQVVGGQPCVPVANRLLARLICEVPDGIDLARELA